MFKYFIRITNHTTGEVYDEWRWVKARTPAEALSRVWRKVADYSESTDKFEIEIQSIS